MDINILILAVWNATFVLIDEFSSCRNVKTPATFSSPDLYNYEIRLEFEGAIRKIGGARRIDALNSFSKELGGTWEENPWCREQEDFVVTMNGVNQTKAALD